MSRDAEIGGGYAASPLDWYVEPRWCVERLIAAEASMRESLLPRMFSAWGMVWDPACGSGTILKAFADARHRTIASDIEFRDFGAGGLFHAVDFLTAERVPESVQGRVSIVSNPPFSYQRGIAEAFVRKALNLATGKVAMLLPIKWQASQGRHALFAEFPPSRIWVLSERPSMPPGALIAEIGDAAFRHGKVDYMWVVWDLQRPATVTEWRTIAPRDKAVRA
jgi:hypothetical protein